MSVRGGKVGVGVYRADKVDEELGSATGTNT